MKNLSFSRSKTNQNVTFQTQKFFKIWHFPKFSIQNLMRCKIFESKPDGFFFRTRNRTRWKIFHLKSLFLICYIRFQLKHCQSVTNIKGQLVRKWQRPVVKCFFSMDGMCLSHFLYYPIAHCVLYGSWAGVWWVCHLHYQLVFTNLLGFQKLVLS